MLVGHKNAGSPVAGIPENSFGLGSDPSNARVNRGSPMDVPQIVPLLNGG